MISQEHLNRIKFSEGFCRVPTKDTIGYCIGYGRNVKTNPLTEEERRFINHPIDAAHPITEKEAEFLLKNDVEKIARKLDQKYPWWRQLDSERQFVVLDMCYTMGIGAMTKFSKAMNNIREGNYDAAAEGIRNSKYYTQVGNRGARNYVCLKTGVYLPSATQRTVDGLVAQHAGRPRPPMTTRQTITYDSQMAQISGKTAANTRKTTRKKTAKTSAKANTKASTKASMKTSADKCKAQMESMIAAMNKKNSKDKAIDGKKAAKALYDKYGNKAPKHLKEAVMSPVKYAKRVKDPSIKTSRDAVNHLVKTATAKSR